MVKIDIHEVGLMVMVNATGEQARLVKTVKVSASHGSGAGIRPSVASEGLTSPTDSGDRYRLGHRPVGCMCIKSLKRLRIRLNVQSGHSKLKPSELVGELCGKVLSLCCAYS